MKSRAEIVFEICTYAATVNAWWCDKLMSYARDIDAGHVRGIAHELRAVSTKDERHNDRCHDWARELLAPAKNYLPPELAAQIMEREASNERAQVSDLGAPLPDDVREMLTILAEECGEVVRRCTKILRFGPCLSG